MKPSNSEIKPLLPDSEPLTDEQIKVNWRARSRFKLGPYPPAIEVLLKIAVIAVIYLVIFLLSMGLSPILKAHLPDAAPVGNGTQKI